MYTISLSMPEDEEQDASLEMSFLFDEDIIFPSWVVNNFDMTFTISPESESLVGIHKFEFKVTDQVVYHCDCAPQTTVLSIKIEVFPFKGKRKVPVKVPAFAFNFVMSDKTDAQPELLVKELSTQGELILEFTQPVYEILEPEIFVDAAVLNIEILTPFDVYDPKKMLKQWKTISMTEKNLVI